MFLLFLIQFLIPKKKLNYQFFMYVYNSSKILLKMIEYTLTRSPNSMRNGFCAGFCSTLNTLTRIESCSRSLVRVKRAATDWAAKFNSEPILFLDMTATHKYLCFWAGNRSKRLLLGWNCRFQALSSSSARNELFSSSPIRCLYAS